MLKIALYWVGQRVCMFFFHKIKDTFLIFTNNFIDLDIWSMSAISRCWLLVGRDQGCCQNVNSTKKLHKPHGHV